MGHTTRLEAAISSYPTRSPAPSLHRLITRLELFLALPCPGELSVAAKKPELHLQHP